LGAWGKVIIVQVSTAVFSGAVENVSCKDGSIPQEELGPYAYDIARRHVQKCR